MFFASKEANSLNQLDWIDFKSCVGACISMLSSFRSNCFGSEVFAYCMGELLVATDMKKQIDSLRESIHGSSFLHK